MSASTYKNEFDAARGFDDDEYWIPGILAEEEAESSRQLTTAENELTRITSQIEAIQLTTGPIGHFIPSRAVLSSASSSAASASDSSFVAESDSAHADENCALWITEIPANATYGMVFDIIKEGKVHILRLQPPDNENRTTQAAKLVFFTHSSAEAFIKRARNPGIFVDAERLLVCWNRRIYAPYNWNHVETEASRVIRITGPDHLMSFEWFEDYFKSKFEYDLEKRQEVFCGRAGYKTHSWAFASVRAQSESAKMAIEREMGGIFEVRYARDPCNQSN